VNFGDFLVLKDEFDFLKIFVICQGHPEITMDLFLRLLIFPRISE